MPETNNQTVSDLRQKLAEMKILPDDNPRSMPAQFYTSEDFLKLETEHVLRREWMCIGHVGEITGTPTLKILIKEASLLLLFHMGVSI